MGGIILVASVIVWALGYFPHNENLTEQQQQEQSYIGRMGKAVEPIFTPQGFNWQLDVSLIAGVGAKEIVASTLGVLYGTSPEEGVGDLLNEISPLTAYCYLLFVLLYFPCIATIVAIRNETSSWRWALFAAVYTTALAWIVSAFTYQIGVLLS